LRPTCVARPHGGHPPIRTATAAPGRPRRGSRIIASPPALGDVALVAVNVVVFAPVRSFDFVSYDDPGSHDNVNVMGGSP